MVRGVGGRVLAHEGQHAADDGRDGRRVCGSDELCRELRTDGWRVSDTITLTPVGAVAWNYRSNADHSLVAEMANASADPVTLFGEGLSDHSFETRLGLEARIAERFTAGLSYGRGWGNDRHSDDRIALSFRAQF